MAKPTPSQLKKFIPKNIRALRVTIDQIDEFGALGEYELTIEQIDLLLRIANATKGICVQLIEEEDR